MDMLIQNFFNIEILIVSWPMLVEGLKMTILLTLFVVPLGFSAGLLIAVLYNLRYWWLRWPIVFYVDFFRAFPPLVLLIFVYYGMPFLGVDLDPFFSVAVAFMLNNSSYYGEIFRAGIESIPKGQTEAARSTGLSGFQTMRWVILPQAIRNVLPDLVGNTVEVVKLTSIASVVALPELLRMARIAQGNMYNPTPLIAAALIYLVILWPVVRILSRMERKMMAGR